MSALGRRVPVWRRVSGWCSPAVLELLKNYAHFLWMCWSCTEKGPPSSLKSLDPLWREEDWISGNRNFLAHRLAGL